VCARKREREREGVCVCSLDRDRGCVRVKNKCGHSLYLWPLALLVATRFTSSGSWDGLFVSEGEKARERGCVWKRECDRGRVCVCLCACETEIENVFV